MMPYLIRKSPLLLFAFLLVSPIGKAETRDQRLKVALRAMAHEFLLQMDDSTSRVLPIKEVEGRYTIRFEKEFSFEPGMLSYAAYKALEETQISEHYIIEVEDCQTNELMHSFEADFVTTFGSVACQQRTIPMGCYIFYFTEVKDAQNQKVAISSSNSNHIYLFVVLFVLVGLLAYFFFGPKRSRAPQNLIEMGQYQFDPKRMLLILNNQSVKLSGKESALLLLLYSNESQTLEREHILETIWGNGNDYVGRTLDVFISKLRKKLEGDTSLEIINIRGIGYRFVMHN